MKTWGSRSRFDVSTCCSARLRISASMPSMERPLVAGWSEAAVAMVTAAGEVVAWGTVAVARAAAAAARVTAAGEGGGGGGEGDGGRGGGGLGDGGGGEGGGGGGEGDGRRGGGGLGNGGGGEGCGGGGEGEGGSGVGGLGDGGGGEGGGGWGGSISIRQASAPHCRHLPAASSQMHCLTTPASKNENVGQSIAFRRVDLLQCSSSDIGVNAEHGTAIGGGLVGGGGG
eukprot:scaffold6835_cov132-Isochrysis_galbana.AAC.1